MYSFTDFSFLKLLSKLFLGISLVVLASCGGNSSSTYTPPAPAYVGFYGDSLTHGGFYEGKKMDISPVTMMTTYANGRWIGTDYAMDGMRCVEHPAVTPNLYAYAFRFGMADHVKGTKLPELADCLTKSVTALISNGARVYITGIIHIPDPIANAELGIWDAKLKEIAINTGATFIDVRSLGQVEMNDDIHPNQIGSDKVSFYIANAIQ